MVLMLMFSGTALGHHVVVPGCGQFVAADTNKGWTIEVTATEFSQLFGPFGHDGDNGPYTVPAGTYHYRYFDAKGKAQESGTFTVSACATPTPRPTPKTPKPPPRLRVTPPPTST